MAEGVDAGDLGLVGLQAFLGLGELRAGDGEALGLEGQLVLRAVADDDQARLARELATAPSKERPAKPTELQRGSANRGPGSRRGGNG